MQVSGMTDLQIIAEAMREEGFTPTQITNRVEEIVSVYMEEMRRVTSNSDQFFHLLPGTREALEAVSQHPRYRSALVTGNIAPAAELKVRLAGIAEFFTLPGAFGDESHDRRDLPALAAERIEQHLNTKLDPRQFIVIGDTPNDIACAKHFGARSVAIASGRMYPQETLIAEQPDALLPDLSDSDRLLDVLDKL
jgi:phosphoglycolate phosphatase-like HAD superfamily hydrolase